MRIGRGYPQQSFTVAGQALGPRKPATLLNAPLAPPIAVDLAVGLATNQRRVQMRFPLQDCQASDSQTIVEQLGRSLSGNSSGGFGTIGSPTASKKFVPRLDTTFESLSIRLRKAGAPTDNVLISVQTDSGGAPSGVNIFTAPLLPMTGLATGSMSEFTFDLGGLALTAGISYWLVMGRDGALNNSNAPVTQDDLNGITYGILWSSSATPQTKRLLGPHPPLIINSLAPVVTTLGVNLAVGLATNQRRAEMRFPLQGWEGQETIETGSAGTISYGGSNKTSSVGYGLTTSGQQSAVSLISPRDATVIAVRVRLAKSGTPTDNTVIEVQTDSGGVPSGVALAVALVAGASLASALTSMSLSLPCSLTAGTQYWLVFRRDGALSDVAFYSTANSDVNPGTFSRALNSGVWVSTASALYFAALTSGDNLGVFARRLGPRPPLFIDPAASGAAPVVTTLAVLSTAVVQRAQLQRHEPKSLLFPPATLAQPPPLFLGPSVRLIQARPRLTHPRFAGPVVVFAPPLTPPIEVIFARVLPRRRPFSVLRNVVVVSAFVASPIQINLQESRVRGLGRRNFPASFFSRPQALQTFSGPKVVLVRIRPRTVVRELGVPVAASAVVLVPVRVRFVQIRPRRVAGFLGLPTVLQTFQAKTSKFVQVRPRLTGKKLGLPTVVIPLPTLQMQTIRTQLVRVLPRPTSKRLAAPVVVSATAVNRQQQTLTISLAAVRTRIEQQRHASHSVVRVPRVVIPLPTLRMQTISVFQPRIKPRPTTKKLSAPTRVIAVPTLRQQTIGVFQPRIKPRPTTKRLFAPTRIIPLPTLRMQTVQVALVRVRPRKTVGLLPEPTVVVAAFIAEPVVVALARTRPRPTSKTLFEPTSIRVPSVEQGEQTIKVALVKARPRPIASKLERPTDLQIFQVGRFALVEARPRPTVRELAAPVVVRQTPVLYPVRVALARIRPRPTARLLGRPTALRTFVTGRVALVRVRPRPTSKKLAPPTRLAVQSVFQAQQTIKTSLVRTRPRPTSRRLAAPTRLAVQSVFQAQQTIKTSLVQIRPRPTTTVLAAPASVGNAFTVLGQQTVRVELVATRPRPTVRKLAAPASIATTTRAVASLSETDPHLGETDASELTEATVSSDSTGTIAELTLGKATEGTVSESELTEAETEAT